MLCCHHILHHQKSFHEISVKISMVASRSKRPASWTRAKTHCSVHVCWSNASLTRLRFCTDLYTHHITLKEEHQGREVYMWWGNSSKHITYSNQAKRRSLVLCHSFKFFANNRVTSPPKDVASRTKLTSHKRFLAWSNAEHGFPSP